MARNLQLKKALDGVERWFDEKRALQRPDKHTDLREIDVEALVEVALRDPKFYTARTKRAVNSGGTL